MSVQISSTFYEKLDSGKVQTAMDRAVHEIMENLWTETTSTSPYDTGKLQDSHTIQGRTSNLRTEALLKVGAKYWGYVEFGTSKMLPRYWILHALLKENVPGEFGRYFKAYYQSIK